MKDHAFYFGLLIVGLIGLAMFAPGNTITGLSIQDCEGCGQLCDLNETCGGLVCCPTVWESGVCHHPESCAAIADISMRQTMEEYVNPEKPQSIHNIAWKNFGLPVLAILAIVALVVILTRK